MKTNRLPLSAAALLLVACSLPAQDPSSQLDLQALKQGLQAGGVNSGQGSDVLPKTLASKVENPAETQKAQALRERQDRTVDEEIRLIKAREKGPKRFASDLFEFRGVQMSATEGGIAEDYVLGAGDQLQISVFGSATFELPAQVDGRGEVVIPKVGSVKVSGLPLSKARAALQAKIAQNFSRATVDLSVTKLREVRVFVMGEVYKPGSYLVPSLSSLVNVLGLAGGPTPAGSFRQIRILRGGKVVHTVDLYPLRAEGLGNMNFSLQSGDTLFVPLAFNQILLEGAFTRVVAEAEAAAQAQVKAPRGKSNLEDENESALPDAQRTLLRQIRRVEAGLEVSPSGAPSGNPSSIPLGFPSAMATPSPATKLLEPSKSFEISSSERAALEEQLYLMRDQLREMKSKARGDQRVPDQDSIVFERIEQPQWLTRWQMDGKVPRMQFESLPGETVADALRFAGGFASQAFAERLSVRRMDAQGAFQVLDVVVKQNSASTPIERGDVLSALPLRDRNERSVQVQGWVRVPSAFARTEGLRVGDLLKRENQILPDTYLGRGEIVRSAMDGRTSYLAFDVTKALAGDPAHNVLVQDRDRVDLYRIEDLRERRTVRVLGPVTRPGTFEFHEGMRAGDLLFQAGVPLRKADRFIAELAHTRDGKPSEVRALDLTKLLSTENGSPVDLKDDVTNPRLEALDQLSLFEKPDYLPHRVVKISGQVARPGSYSLDKDGEGLADLLSRAGGLTSDAMPEGAIFLRRMGLDADKLKAMELAGIESSDPTGNGINDILGRLSETKRQPLTGQILKTPVLHGLTTGAANRMVVNLPAVLKGDHQSDVTLQDGDEIVIPRKSDAAYVVGEAASPFVSFRVKNGMSVRQVIRLAGGTTRNADTWNIRLLKADGRILDSWVSFRKVEPGDAVLVPSKVKRDVAWQENLAAIANLAVAYAAVKK